MGLFCRVLSQLLLVLDDADLHQRQAPFSLGTSRAIASTLNSLVFHQFFPAPRGQQRQQPGQAQAAAAHTAAPDVLAAGVLPQTTLGHGLVSERGSSSGSSSGSRSFKQRMGPEPADTVRSC